MLAIFSSSLDANCDTALIGTLRSALKRKAAVYLSGRMPPMSCFILSGTVTLWTPPVSTPLVQCCSVSPTLTITSAGLSGETGANVPG